LVTRRRKAFNAAAISTNQTNRSAPFRSREDNRRRGDGPEPLPSPPQPPPPLTKTYAQYKQKPAESLQGRTHGQTRSRHESSFVNGSQELPFHVGNKPFARREKRFFFLSLDKLKVPLVRGNVENMSNQICKYFGFGCWPERNCKVFCETIIIRTSPNGRNKHEIPELQ